MDCPRGLPTFFRYGAGTSGAVDQRSHPPTSGQLLHGWLASGRGMQWLQRRVPGDDQHICAASWLQRRRRRVRRAWRDGRRVRSSNQGVYIRQTDFFFARPRPTCFCSIENVAFCTLTSTQFGLYTKECAKCRWPDLQGAAHCQTVCLCFAANVTGSIRRRGQSYAPVVAPSDGMFCRLPQGWLWAPTLRDLN